MTTDGETQFKEYLDAVKEARACPVKRKMEKDHLAYVKGIWDIQSSSYEKDEKRRNRAAAKEGIATETPEEQAWTDSELFSDDEEE